MSRQVYSDKLTADDVKSTYIRFAQIKLDDDLFITPAVPEYAIALIDTSASTKLKFAEAKIAMLADEFENSVFGKQCEILKKLPHKYFYLLFWCSAQNSGRFVNGFRAIPGPVKTESMELIFKTEFYQIEDRHLTDTSIGFKNIPPEWLKATDTVYLVTDGEMGGGGLDVSRIKSDLSNKLKTFEGSLSILTVERAARNYNNADEVSRAAGTDVFQTIQDQKLTGFLTCFKSHYPSANAGDGADGANATDNFYNHISRTAAPKGYIPYGDKYFLEIKMDKFIQTVAHELSQHPLESDQLKIAQKLSVTLGVLLKNKSQPMIESNIRTFSKLFTIDPQAIYYILGDSLLAEQQGRAQILSSYRSSLTNLYKDAQQKLTENVAKAINLGTTFYSYPRFNPETKSLHILTGPSRLVNESFKAGNVKFPKSCVGQTPVFGGSGGDTPFNEQCVRQWTRAVYSTRYPVKTGDDAIIYMVLIDALAVSRSNGANQTIENVYLNLARSMLKKKRPQVNITEAEYLLAGNAPTGGSGTFAEFISILTDVLSMMNINAKPMRVWHEIVGMLDSIFPGMYDAQKIHTLNHPDMLGVANETPLILPEIIVDNIPVTSAYDYTCYITMDDLTSVGGYTFKHHPTPAGHYCSPIFMISDSGMKELATGGRMICPVCYSQLTAEDYDHVGPYVESKPPALYDKPYGSPSVEQSSANDEDSRQKRSFLDEKKACPIQECYLIVMKGTVGAGKSTLSDFIQRKYTALGYKVFNEGTDKYCKLGMAPNKAAQMVAREFKLAVKYTNKCIVIIDTCGESRSPKPFGVSFAGWKTIEIYPNLIENDKMGYLAWTLTNVLERGRTDASSAYYLTPYAKPEMKDGIELCKEVHKKKASSLGLYDHAFSRLSDNDRVALSSEYAKKLKPCEFNLGMY